MVLLCATTLVCLIFSFKMLDMENAFGLGDFCMVRVLQAWAGVGGGWWGGVVSSLWDALRRG
jgi:hypothetical protein